MQEISQPHNQSVSFSNEYFPFCNRKINIDLNEFLHSLIRNKKKNIQIEYFTEIHMVIPNNIQYVPQYLIHMSQIHASEDVVINA